jgi:hypothetical protein
MVGGSSRRYFVPLTSTVQPALAPSESISIADLDTKATPYNAVIRICVISISKITYDACETCKTKLQTGGGLELKTHMICVRLRKSEISIRCSIDKTWSTRVTVYTFSTCFRYYYYDSRNTLRRNSHVRGSRRGSFVYVMDVNRLACPASCARILAVQSHNRNTCRSTLPFFCMKCKEGKSSKMIASIGTAIVKDASVSADNTVEVKTDAV